MPADVPVALPADVTVAADTLQRFYDGDVTDDQLQAAFEGLSIDDGLAIQAELFQRRRAAGAVLTGYKVGLTSDRARKLVGSDTRPFGHLSNVWSAGHTFAAVAPAGGDGQLAMGGQLSIEPELCFVMARPLGGPDVTPEQAAAAVGQVHAAFEINERRVPGGNVALLIADNLTNHAIVQGDGTQHALPAAQLDACQVTLTCNGNERFTDTASNHVDNPYTSIAALTTTLHRHGLALQPGHRMITGAYCRFTLQPGETWRASYSNIGAVEVTIT